MELKYRISGKVKSGTKSYSLCIVAIYRTVFRQIPCGSMGLGGKEPVVLIKMLNCYGNT